MIGWYSELYLISNANLPIYIYKNQEGKNVFVLKLTNSISEYPDNIHNWICQGELVELINKINFSNDLVKNKSYDNPYKKRRISS